MIKTSPCNHNPVPRNKYTDLYSLTKQVFKCLLHCLMTISEHCIDTTGILSRTIPATRTTTIMNMQHNRTHICTEIESEPIGGFFPSMESIGVCGSGTYLTQHHSWGTSGGQLRACPQQLGLYPTTDGSILGSHSCRSENGLSDWVDLVAFY